MGCEDRSEHEIVTGLGKLKLVLKHVMIADWRNRMSERIGSVECRRSCERRIFSHVEGSGLPYLIISSTGFRSDLRFELALAGWGREHLWVPQACLKLTLFLRLQPIHTLEWQMREGLVAFHAKTSLESYQVYRAPLRNTHTSMCCARTSQIVGFHLAQSRRIHFPERPILLIVLRL